MAMLQAALNRTSKEFGPAKVSLVNEVINEKRQLALLINGSPKLDVIFRPTAGDIEQQLTPIRIPIDKGLLGYRIFLIRAADQPKFSRITSVEELKRLRGGQAREWLDVAIYTGNGFRLVTGSAYEGLFAMLVNGRFDYFPRSVIEVYPEFDSHRRQMPGLAVEQDLMIHYPFARYYWVANNEKGIRLRTRITKGLESMIRDGSFDQLFMKFNRGAIDRAGLAHRRVFEIKNGSLPHTVPLDRSELWFDPLKPAHGSDATSPS